jgi:hypothetical protein
MVFGNNGNSGRSARIGWQPQKWHAGGLKHDVGRAISVRV